MRMFLAAVATAAPLLYGPAASAVPIAAGSELSLNGSDSFTATATTFSIDFVNPANIGGTSGSFAAALGIIPPEVDNAATMIANLTDTSTNFELYSATNQGATSTLIAGAITGFQFTPGTLESLAVQGTGTLTLTGFDDTPGIWDLTTQGPGGPVEVTFSNTATPAGVPEPNTLALLGVALAALGLLGWQCHRNDAACTG